MVDMNLIDCLIYLTDIVVFSISEEHIERMEAVFTRLQINALKIKTINCEFFKRETQSIYLRNVVFEQEICTDPSKMYATGQSPGM